MAIDINKEDRLMLCGSRLASTPSGRLSICKNTGSLVLELNVKGTFFPQRESGTNGQYIFANIANKDGSIDIDFADGTGLHHYDFKAYSSNRRIEFTAWGDKYNPNSPTTPENIFKAGTYNYPGHFYQDLPEGVKGTIDDDYESFRTIKIRFNDFSFLDSFQISYSALYGSLSPLFSRFRNISTLSLGGCHFVTEFSKNLQKLYCKNFTLATMGFKYSEIPEYILNSPSLETLSLDQQCDFSNTSLEDSKIAELFELPNLVNINLKGCDLHWQLPNPNHDITGIANFDLNGDSGFRISADLSHWKCYQLRLYYTGFPSSEYQRLLNGLSYVTYFTMYTTPNTLDDFDIDDNYTINYMIVGGYYGGVLPTFLKRLHVCTDLAIYVNNSYSGGLPTSWGTAGISNSVQTLKIGYMSLLPPELPSWFTDLVNLTTFQSLSWTTQQRIDDHVDSFYTMVDSNSPKTGTGLWRGLNWTISGASGYPTNARPSGTYQEPSGYSQGSSNGTPASQMEEIWVLVHQYNMIVQVMNSAGNGKDIYTP